MEAITEKLLQITSTILVSIVTPVVLQRLRSSRSSIKEDFEILKLVREAELPDDVIIAKIHTQLNALYSRRTFKVYSWANLNLGIIFLALSLWWLFELVQSDWSWWFPVAVFVALLGIAGISNGFDPRYGEKKTL